jgi:hypothetical protein
MRESVWLFIYVVDKQTKGIKDGRGQVLGGSPIRDRDIAEALRMSTKTIARWREVLLTEGYVTARRTPYGFVYAVSKPKRWAERDQTRMSTLRSDTIGKRDQTQTARDRTTLSETKKREKGYKRETHSPDFSPEMEKWIWDYYVEMIAKGQAPKQAANNLPRAITAFANDDYHMGRKKGYEGAGRKGLEEIFETQDAARSGARSTTRRSRIKSPLC